LFICSTPTVCVCAALPAVSEYAAPTTVCAWETPPTVCVCAAPLTGRIYAAFPTVCVCAAPPTDVWRGCGRKEGECIEAVFGLFGYFPREQQVGTYVIIFSADPQMGTICAIIILEDPLIDFQGATGWDVPYEHSLRCEL